jgi:hypothetical protein
MSGRPLLPLDLVRLERELVVVFLVREPVLLELSTSALSAISSRADCASSICTELLRLAQLRDALLERLDVPACVS